MQTSEPKSKCECFGDSGIHASTFRPLGSDVYHCDLCGLPVAGDSVDALTLVNSAPDLVEIDSVARVGKSPCGECHLQAGETCDICGAKAA